MMVDIHLDDVDLYDVPSAAAAAEVADAAAVWLPEATSDPFLGAVLALEHTHRVDVGTAIAVAFARNPMSVAYTSVALQRFRPEGRFTLGLGTQVKAHIERRYSMPWSDPVSRIREFVLALRAIWQSWHDGTPLSFSGDHYRHTLMTPFFTPAADGWQPPSVYLAALGPAMTRVAGEVADGVLVHSIATDKFIRDVTLPSLRAGAARAERHDLPAVSHRQLVATGRNEEELLAAREAVRRQVAFYGSTPAYRDVFALHGLGELQTELSALAARESPSRWSDMSALIDDSTLQIFAVVANPEDVADSVIGRCADCVDRVAIYAPYKLAPDLNQHIVSMLRRNARMRA